MLKIKTRQRYLKTLGFYSGAIDGKEGNGTKAAYMKLQRAYFRGKDCDGKYGRNTDILLINAIRVHAYCKDFNLREFKCECGGRYCTGYPVILDRQLLRNVQAMRKHYKKPILITSGLRCAGYNAELGGSISNSRHTRGKAVDMYIRGNTTSERGRLSVMKYWMNLYRANFSYCYLPTKYRTWLEKTATYMGDAGGAVHCDVK